MTSIETRDPDALSDEKRCLLIGENLWIHRQPGGCVEIGEDEGGDAEVVHVCDDDELDQIIAGLQVIRDRVPKRF